MTEELPEWRRKAREWQAAQEAKKARPVAVEHDADLIPEPEYDVDPVDMEIDQIVDGIDILEAYRRWCGKMVPEVGTKRESIMISCPKPDHPDKVPSAWINLDKQTWFCGGCQEGGDALDIAAYHFGYDVPGYKQGKSFPDLRRRIAEEFGVVVRRTPTGQRYTDTITVEEPAAEPPNTKNTNGVEPGATHEPPSFSVPVSVFPSSTPVKVSEPTAEIIQLKANPVTPPGGGCSEAGAEAGEPSGKPEATITDVSGMFLEAEDLAAPPSIPWRDIVTDVGFLDEWMGATSHDDLPEEYYFMLGLMALGLAAGRDVVLGDQPVVRGNLYVCTLGPSGSGKSRAAGVFQRLLADALPYDDSDPFSKGTAFMSPGSAESLIDGFSKPIVDPSDPKVVMGHAGVRGLVRFDELSTLVGRSVRTGSVLKPTLMEFYDGYSEVTHRTRGVGMIRAVDHFACAITTSQPRAIKNLLTTDDADSGFLNRWIFAMGPSKEAKSFGGVSFDITRAVAALQRTMAWCSTHTRPLLPTSDALAAWDDHFKNVLLPLKRGIDADALLARIDLTMKKIMLLLAIDRHHDMIEVEDVQGALMMWDYLIESYAYVSGQIGFGPFEEIHQAVIKVSMAAAQGGRGAMAMREINRSLHRRKYPIDLLAKVVSAMVIVGELEEEVTKPARGPATVKYKWVD